MSLPLTGAISFSGDALVTAPPGAALLTGMTIAWSSRGVPFIAVPAASASIRTAASSCSELERASWGPCDVHHITARELRLTIRRIFTNADNRLHTFARSCALTLEGRYMSDIMILSIL